MPATVKKVTVILDPEDGGGYSVHCPALPGCVSQGEGQEDALENIKEAIVLVLETLDKDEVVRAAVVLEAIEGKDIPPRENPDRLADEIREVLRARAEDGLPPTIETVQVEVSLTVSA